MTRASFDWEILDGKGAVIDRATNERLARRRAYDLHTPWGPNSYRRQNISVRHAPSGEVIANYRMGPRRAA